MSENAPRVEIETTLGTITLELFAKDTPVTVDNFLAYVKSGHYVNTIFHRVIPGFMIQGGGLTADMSPKPTLPPIPTSAAQSPWRAPA